MPWCLADPRLPTVTFRSAGLGVTVDPDRFIMPDGHTSCLIESSSRVTGFFDILDVPPGTFIKVDIVYNIGDGKRWT